MSLESWLIFIAISIVPVMSPGPSILLSVSNSLKYGAKYTLFTGLANASGQVVLGCMVGLGAGALMTASAFLYVALKVFAGTYLLWLGWNIIRDQSTLQLDGESLAEAPKLTNLIVQSFLVSVTNPKALVLMAALFPPFISSTGAIGTQVFLLAATYGVLCALNHALIAFSGGWLRKRLQSSSIIHRIRLIVGAIFGGFGALLILSAREN